MFNKKAQGSLEYLLLIGGAVLIAAIVIALVVSSSSSASDVTKCNAIKALCTSKYSGTSCPTGAKVTLQGVDYTCVTDSTNKVCSFSGSAPC